MAAANMLLCATKAPPAVSISSGATTRLSTGTSCQQNNYIAEKKHKGSCAIAPSTTLTYTSSQLPIHLHRLIKAAGCQPVAACVIRDGAHVHCVTAQLGNNLSCAYVVDVHCCLGSTCMQHKSTCHDGRWTGQGRSTHSPEEESVAIQPQCAKACRPETACDHLGLGDKRMLPPFEPLVDKYKQGHCMMLRSCGIS